MSHFQRLPSDVIPTSYNVSLKPDLVNFTFQGWEIISVTVKSATEKIVLNAFDIHIVKASLKVKDAASGERTPGQTVCDPKSETVTFTFDEIIKPGEYSLSIDFTGNLNNQLRGFYRNKYLTPNGETRHAAVTHFEATGARRAYPCWDEPAIKATFDFTLIAPMDRVALCNMPVVEESVSKDDPGLKVVRFQTTPVMPTYLTAFVVGEYDFVESSTSNGTKIRVYTPVGKAEHGRFALEFATKALSYYEDYFKVPYGLPKLDLITLTEFSIGAMENWGLVTYREVALLIDPDKSSASARQYVALIVAHELSHNWFGNLVTMRWWSDLWLKEGFATWIEFLCVDVLMPELHIWNYFIKTDQKQALALDALSNSHPVQVEVGNPGEIDEIFDAISYCKGASLIRMLESYIGAETFRSGMHLYLTRHKFGNTDTVDLWKCMSEVTGQDVKQLMDSWTQQMGFPLIRVEEELLAGNVRRLTISQEKFCSSQVGGGSKDETTKAFRWSVPFSVITSSSPDVPVLTGLLDGESTAICIDDCKPGDWIKVNPRQSMFYHVLYSQDSLQRLLPAVESQVLPVEDRLGLLNDLFALGKSDYMKIPDVLTATQSFRNDPDFSVCDSLGKLLSSLGPYMETVALTLGLDNTYRRFICDSLRGMGERIGWDAKDSEDDTHLMMRENMLTYLGVNGDAKVKAEAFRRFHSHVKGEKSLPADIKSPVYATVLCHGDNDVYDSIMKLYDTDTSTEDTSRIQRCLGLMQQRIPDVLEFSVSDKVRHSDACHVMGGVTHTVEGRRLLSQFVMANWNELYSRYSTSTMLRRLVEVSTRGVCNEAAASKLEEFFKDRDAKAASRAIKQGLEHIRANAALLKSQSQHIAAFLTSFK